MTSVMLPCCDPDEPPLTRRELFRQAVEAASVRDVPAFAALVDGNVREVLRNYEDIFCLVTRVRGSEDLVLKLLELDSTGEDESLARVHVRFLRYAPLEDSQDVVRALCRHYASYRNLQQVLEKFGTLENSQDPEFRVNTFNFLILPMKRLTQEHVNEKLAADILKIYLENGVNVDSRYKLDGGESAVHYAAYNNLWQCVEVLLASKANIDHVYEGSTARQIIENRMLHELFVKYKYPDVPAREMYDVTVALFNALYDSDEEKFQNIYLATLTQHGKYTDDDWNLLCKLAPISYIMEFVSDGENSDEIDAPQASLFFSQDDGWNTLLQLACRKNLPEAVRTILETECDPDGVSDLKDPPLLLAAENGCWDIVLQLVSHKSCEGCGEVDVNVTGDHGDTVLHKLARAWHVARREIGEEDEEIVSRILDVLDTRSELDINNLNTKQETPLQIATKCCDKRLFNLFLKKGAFLGVSKEILRDIRYEDLENMLNTTLSTEQYKGHKFVNINFECLYLQYDIPNVPEFNIYPEMLPLYKISKSKTHKILLSHPLITSFLDLKWLRFHSIYFLNFLLYMGFVVSLTCHVCFLTARDEERAAVSMWFTGAFWLYMLSRELMQLTMSYSEYFKTVENWLELFIIIATGILLNHGIDTYTTFLILAAYSEFSLLLGRHPKVATYIAMFLRVSKVNVLLLVLSSPIIFAFATCFTILLRHDTENPYFHNSTASMFKTLVMITGEFEFGDIKFDVNPVLSKFIFVLFVVIIAIILMNLLNALAVNDTEAIQRDAEIISLQAKVELFTKIESALLGYPMDWYLNTWDPNNNSKFFYSLFKLRAKFFKQFLIGSSVLPFSENNKFLFSIREDGKIMDRVTLENGKVAMKDNDVFNVSPKSRLLRVIMRNILGVNSRAMFDHSYYFAAYVEKSSSDEQLAEEVAEIRREFSTAMGVQGREMKELRKSNAVQAKRIQRLSEDLIVLQQSSKGQSDVLGEMKKMLTMQSSVMEKLTQEISDLKMDIKVLINDSNKSKKEQV